MKIAMISYNTFVKGSENGWKEGNGGSILLLQNQNGSAWGLPQFVPPQSGAQFCRDMINCLWDKLREVLPTIDKVIFYVGSNGAERAIELAAENGLTPDRAIFVFCDCNYSVKAELIRSRGFSCSKVVGCERGGYSTMRRIYNDFLAEGKLP